MARETYLSGISSVFESRVRFPVAPLTVRADMRTCCPEQRAVEAGVTRGGSPSRDGRRSKAGVDAGRA